MPVKKQKVKRAAPKRAAPKRAAPKKRTPRTVGGSKIQIRPNPYAGMYPENKRLVVMQPDLERDKLIQALPILRKIRGNMQEHRDKIHRKVKGGNFRKGFNEFSSGFKSGFDLVAKPFELAAKFL